MGADVHRPSRRASASRSTLAHRKFKRPPKPDDQTAASQDGPRRDVCGSEIVAAAPIRTVSPLPLGLVGP